MRKTNDKVVPVAGINQHLKSNSFPGAARSFGGVGRPSLHAVLLALGVWAFAVGVVLATSAGADLARFGYPTCEGEE